ncbi:MAG: hypothetical protein J7495_12095 [Sphingomonas sp.]|nr:hypothetical protein [Sphingomonas sp.]
MWRGWRPAVAGVAVLVLSGVAPAQRSPATLTALRGLERGQWQLKDTEDGTTRKLCLSDPSTLLQLQHGNTQCSHFVVEDSASAATIHYTCPGHGYGRTTVSVETPRLVRVDTQGVLDGAPFAKELEGRRMGACG